MDRTFELFTFFLVACNGILTGVQVSVDPSIGFQPYLRKVKGTPSGAA